MFNKTLFSKRMLWSSVLIISPLFVSGCYTYRQELTPPTKSVPQVKDQVSGKMTEAVTPDQRAQALTDSMKTKLNLTPAQTTEIGKINQDYAARIAKLMASDQSTMDKKAEFKRLTIIKRADIKKLLNTDQQQLFDKHKNEWVDTY
ncbi:hypothetical protein [Thiolinea disciformis]|uniref:hypothetical protein n=1 Tax=Thiolinea disciformis TaxID=125614 RepID=UPI0003695332|nr:hypothetical protein [Thiolinea disciformis]